MSTPDQSLECVNPNCGWCLNAAREREAERGLRCSNCLESFDKPYPMQSEELPELCLSCARVAMAPKSSGGGMYGTRPAQRPPSDGLSAPVSDREASGRGLDAGGAA